MIWPTLEDLMKNSIKVGFYINCNKRFGSLAYSGYKGMIEEIKGINNQWVNLSNGKDREAQCVINLNDYPDMEIMDMIDVKIFRELGV